MLRRRRFTPTQTFSARHDNQRLTVLYAYGITISAEEAWLTNGFPHKHIVLSTPTVMSGTPKIEAGIFLFHMGFLPLPGPFKKQIVH